MSDSEEVVPLGPAVDAALAELRTRVPGVCLDRSAVLARVREQVGDPAPAGELTRLAIGDLAWAEAVLASDSAASAAFERDVLGAIDGAVRRVDATDAFVDAVRHELRVKMLVGEGAAGPRLRAYAGRGPLRHWVIDAAIFDDAERAYVRAESRALLKKWMEEGLRALDDRRRAVLHLYFVEDVSSEAIARMYGVHRGTVARWIEEARASVRSHIERRALATPGMGREGVDSLLRAADGHLSLSLSLLRS
jgi:RNA polymerase sigma-70 factor (ECF subfamily)